MRTDTRAIAIVRKRATMPSVMSMATAIATALGGARDGEHEDAGRDVVEVLLAPARHAGQPGAERVAEHEHEEQQEDQRDADGDGGSATG